MKRLTLTFSILWDRGQCRQVRLQCHPFEWHRFAERSPGSWILWLGPLSLGYYVDGA